MRSVERENNHIGMLADAAHAADPRSHPGQDPLRFAKAGEALTHGCAGAFAAGQRHAGGAAPVRIG